MAEGRSEEFHKSTNGDVYDTSVFDKAMETAHPMFHGYLKAAKDYSIAAKKFAEGTKDWPKNG